jgi:hypothetical protein
MQQVISKIVRDSILRAGGLFCVVILSVLCVLPAHAEENKSTNDSAQILQAFNQQHREAERAKSITDKDKQRVMFMLGAVLLTLVLITGGLGIAMGLYGKQVFVAHMIFAGLSMTLAIAHAIVGIVWFYPF